MNIKNNIEIVKLDDLGRGIGYIDNKIVFIPNTLIKEVVDIEIIKETTKYYVGKVIKYLKTSDKRIESLCPYYNECGGCNLLHMSYKDQILYKEEKLKNILKKFSNIETDIEVTENKSVFGYRNKIDLKVEHGEWGYFNSFTHNFIPIDKCLISKDSINKVIECKEYISFNNGSIVIRSNYNDEILLSIKTLDDVSIDIDMLKNNIKLAGIVINNKNYYGDNFFFESINNKLFKVNYDSFFQVNNYMALNMLNILSNNSDGNTLLDLYCGVGFLSQGVNNKFEKIYGIEKNKSSVIDAVNNASINKINNAYYICDDSSKVKSKIKDSIDVLFIDPPRTGLVKNMIKDVLSFNAKTVIYISCDPISLARDLNILKEEYEIKKVYLLDMFSNTHHVESVSILKLKAF